MNDIREGDLLLCVDATHTILVKGCIYRAASTYRRGCATVSIVNFLTGERLSYCPDRFKKIKLRTTDRVVWNHDKAKETGGFYPWVKRGRTYRVDKVADNPLTFIQVNDYHGNYEWINPVGFTLLRDDMEEKIEVDDEVEVRLRGIVRGVQSAQCRVKIRENVYWFDREDLVLVKKAALPPAAGEEAWMIPKTTNTDPTRVFVIAIDGHLAFIRDGKTHELVRADLLWRGEK